MNSLAQAALRGPTTSDKVRVNLWQMGFRPDPFEIYEIRDVGNWVSKQLRELQMPQGSLTVLALTRAPRRRYVYEMVRVESRLPNQEQQGQVLVMVLH